MKKEPTEVVLTPGHDDDKYVATALVTEDGEGGVKHRVNLTIKNADHVDEKKTYRLVASNREGSQNYTFRMVVTKNETTTPSTPTGTDGGSTGGGGGSGGFDDTGSLVSKSSGAATAGYIILTVAIILVLTIGGWFVMKKRNMRVEAGPLSNREARP